MDIQLSTVVVFVCSLVIALGVNVLIYILSTNRACLMRRKILPGLISLEETMRFVRVLIDCEIKPTQTSLLKETDEKLKKLGELFSQFSYHCKCLFVKIFQVASCYRN